MRLRKLELKDAALMLEWMHDQDVVKDLQANFMQKTIEDCQRFINESSQNITEIHLAIVDDEDTYMGTVSLKHIRNQMAEFAIVIRRQAMGKGLSKYAMSEIIHMGFTKIGLKKIYWCVDPKNERAVRFYNKNGYRRIYEEDVKKMAEGYSTEQIEEYWWYLATAE